MSIFPKRRQCLGPSLGSQPAEKGSEPIGVEGSDRADQSFVNSRYQRDRPAGDAGNCVRRPHAEAAEVDTNQIAECRHYQPVGDRRHW